MNNISALEEMILLIILIADGKAYTVSITSEYHDQSGKSISIPAVHTVLERLENRGIIKSSLGGATSMRGGRRKRLFKITRTGYEMVQKVKEKRSELWDAAPKLSFD